MENQEKIKNIHILMRKPYKIIPNFSSEQQVKNPVISADFDDLASMAEWILERFQNKKDTPFFFQDRLFIFYWEKKRLYYGLQFDLDEESITIRYAEEFSEEKYKGRSFQKKKNLKSLILPHPEKKKRQGIRKVEKSLSSLRMTKEEKKKDKYAAWQEKRKIANEVQVINGKEKRSHWGNTLENITSFSKKREKVRGKSISFKIKFSKHLSKKRDGEKGKRQSLSSDAIRRILAAFIIKKRPDLEIVKILDGYLEGKVEKQLVFSFPDETRNGNIAILVAIHRFTNQYGKYINTPEGFLFTIVTMLEESRQKSKNKTLLHFPNVPRVYLDDERISKIIKEERTHL